MASIMQRGDSFLIRVSNGFDASMDVYGHAMKHMDKKAAEALEKMIG